MSQSIGQFWGFEIRRQALGGRSALLQFVGNIGNKSIAPLPPTPTISQPLPQTPTTTVTISWGNGNSFTVSVPTALVSNTQAPLGAGVLGRPVLPSNSATPSVVIDIPQALVAASGELQVHHDPLTALAQMFRGAQPANTNASPTPPPGTHQPTSQSANPTLTHTPSPQAPTVTPPPSSSSLATPTPHATQAHAPQAPILNVRKELSLEQSFQLLLKPKNEEVRNSGRNLAQEFRAELAQKAPLEVAKALKEAGYQAPRELQKVVAEAVQKLIAQLTSGQVIPKEISTNARIPNILLRLARELIAPKAELAGRGKDGFVTDQRTVLFNRTFGPTMRSNALATGPRLFAQILQQPSSAYPQAPGSFAAKNFPGFTPQASQGTHSTPSAALPQGPFAAAPGTAQPTNPLFPGVVSTPFASPSAAYVNSTDPYAFPFPMGYGAPAENDTGAPVSPEDLSQERAFGDERDQQQGQPRHAYQNGVSIDELMENGVLRTLNARDGIQVIKFFFRRSGRIHLLDAIYDHQHLLNPHAGPINHYLYVAGTDQGFYNQHSGRSSGEVMQILIGDVQRLATQSPNLSLPPSAALNDNFKAIHNAA